MPGSWFNRSAMSGTLPATHTPASGMEDLRGRLQEYLRRHLERAQLELSSIDAIPGGHSGFTYFVTASDGGWARRYVLPLPPPGARITGPADDLPQGRIKARPHEQGLPPARHSTNVQSPTRRDG